MLNKKQKKVIFGVIPALIFVVSFLYVGYYVLSFSVAADTAEKRLILALRWQILPLFTLFLGVGLVANSRFLTEAINPLDGTDSKRMVVYKRYLSNTLEQVALFFVATMVLATFLDAQSIKLIPILAALFFIGRMAFLIGYLIHPLYRAFGMGVTLYPTIFIVFYDLYRVLL